MKASQISVAKFLEQQLAMCGRSQREVADEVGYQNQNMITMLKQGRTKVPYPLVGKLAAAIDTDPAYFLRLVMQEYDPDLWETMETILAAQMLLTADERALVELIRDASQGCPLDLTSLDARALLSDAINAVALTTQRQSQAAVEALDRLPRNCRHPRL